MRVLDEGFAIGDTLLDSKENDLVVTVEPEPPSSRARRLSNPTIHHRSARPVVRVVSTSSVVAENLNVDPPEATDKFHADSLDESSSRSKSKRHKADPRKGRDTIQKSESANPG